MRTGLIAFITTLGETFGEVQVRRQRRQDWRTAEWRERFDVPDWRHITGESPTIRPQG